MIIADTLATPLRLMPPLRRRHIRATLIRLPFAITAMPLMPIFRRFSPSRVRHAAAVADADADTR